VLLVVLSWARLFDPGAISYQIDLGTSAPLGANVIVALTLPSWAFTSLDRLRACRVKFDVAARPESAGVLVSATVVDARVLGSGWWR